LKSISVPVEDAKKKAKSVEIVETDEDVDVSEEEEEVEEETSASSGEESDHTDNDEGDLEGADSDEDWSEEKNTKEEDAKRKAALLKRKRKAVEKKTGAKKIKKLETDVNVKTDVNGKGKKPVKGKAKAEKKEETSTGEKKKDLPDFSDKNVDVNLYNDDPNTVNLKRIKISENVVVSCKMISVNPKQANWFEYAAIVFARKGNTEKAFEYNLPLNLAPKIIAALNYIVKENPKFFQSFENSSTNMKKSE
jgi:hypothetical protein